MLSQGPSSVGQSWGTCLYIKSLYSRGSSQCDHKDSLKRCLGALKPLQKKVAIYDSRLPMHPPTPAGECKRHSRIFDRPHTLFEPHYSLWKIGIFTSQGCYKVKGMVFADILKVSDHPSPINKLSGDRHYCSLFDLCEFS